MKQWYISQFPESLYPCPPDMKREYGQQVIRGYEKIRRSKVVVCALARDIESVFPYFRARVERLLSMSHLVGYVVIYENDSSDNTLSLLKDWKKNKDNVYILTERLSHPMLSDLSLVRRQNMAYYRNKYLDFITESELVKNTDYVIVLDSDLLGGFSYDGLAHTFGMSEDFGAVGSNGILYRKNNEDKMERIFFDWWAFRRLGQENPGNIGEINRYVYSRGEFPFQVNSCFGGMAVYNSMVFNDSNIRYTEADCDHPTLHRKMRTKGYKIYFNPNQICLYSETNYVI